MDQMWKEYAILTQKGGRSVNEDKVLIKEFSHLSAVIVADGLGGAGGGAAASQAAVEKLASCFECGMYQSSEALFKAVRMANEAVLSCQTQECKMCTTIVALLLHGKQAQWIHVGDSRLYHFRNLKLETSTMDHSVPQMAVMMGMINWEDIRSHPDRNRLLRALGSSEATPDISAPISLADGMHSFLLCTDGFWEYVTENEMEKTLAASANPKEWLFKMEQLIKTKAPANQDNYTAAAVYVRKGPTAYFP